MIAKRVECYDDDRQCMPDGMQWSAAGVHEVEYVQGDIRIFQYSDMQGNAEDYMLECVCQKGMTNAERWGMTVLQLNDLCGVVLSISRGASG